MTGRALNKPGIMVHDNMSPGAIKLRKKVAKSFSNIFYHTYNKAEEKAEHLTRGVSASWNTPREFRNKLEQTKIIGLASRGRVKPKPNFKIPHIKKTINVRS